MRKLFPPTPSCTRRWGSSPLLVLSCPNPPSTTRPTFPTTMAERSTSILRRWNMGGSDAHQSMIIMSSGTSLPPLSLIIAPPAAPLCRTSHPPLVTESEGATLAGDAPRTANPAALKQGSASAPCIKHAATRAPRRSRKHDMEFRCVYKFPKGDIRRQIVPSFSKSWAGVHGRRVAVEGRCVVLQLGQLSEGWVIPLPPSPEWPPAMYSP